MAGDLPIQMQPAVSMGPAGTRPGAVSGAECHACEPTASAPVDRPRPYIPTRLVLLCLLPRFHAAALFSAPTAFPCVALHRLSSAFWTAFPWPSRLPFDELPLVFHGLPQPFLGLPLPFIGPSPPFGGGLLLHLHSRFTSVSLPRRLGHRAKRRAGSRQVRREPCGRCLSSTFYCLSTANLLPIHCLFTTFHCLFTAFSPPSTAYSLPSTAFSPPSTAARAHVRYSQRLTLPRPRPPPQVLQTVCKCVLPQVTRAPADTPPPVARRSWRPPAARVE